MSAAESGSNGNTKRTPTTAPDRIAKVAWNKNLVFRRPALLECPRVDILSKALISSAEDPGAKRGPDGTCEPLLGPGNGWDGEGVVGGDGDRPAPWVCSREVSLPGNGSARGATSLSNHWFLAARCSASLIRLSAGDSWLRVPSPGVGSLA